ncbi:MAG TPA: hypothetical protein IGS40_21060 [Trichormus sp. M33_DOE_039]|nr:hypothetical protein [Trichormus sp. M33_DOE_039]
MLAVAIDEKLRCQWQTGHGCSKRFERGQVTGRSWLTIEMKHPCSREPIPLIQ